MCKYSSNGELLWLENAGGKNIDQGQAMTIHNGNLYVTGVFSDTLYMKNDTMISYEGQDMFLFKYSFELSNVGSIAIKDPKFKIYPVPSDHFINIESVHMLNDNLSVELIDTNGRIVLQEMFQNRISLDISFITAGVYIIRVTGTGITEVSKVVKN